MLKRGKYNQIINIFYIHKAILYYLFGNFSKSLEKTTIAIKSSGLILGDYNITRQNLYHSLALLALYPDTRKRDQRSYLKKGTVKPENDEKVGAPCSHEPHA